MNPFHILFQDALSEQDLKVKEFAAKVDVSPSFITQVKRGSKAPPIKSIDRWCDELALSGSKRKVFTLAAHMAHCDKLLVNYVHSLLKELQRDF